MRVLRVIGGVDPAFGGPSVSSISSCIAAQRAGVTTAVVFPLEEDGPGSVAERLARDGVEVTRFVLPRPFRRMCRRWGVSFALARWLLREAATFDVIHAHGAWTFTTMTSLIVAKAKGRAAVLSTHETLTDFDVARSAPPVRAAKRALRRFYLRSFDLVVTSSDLERRDSRCESARARVVVLAHPVEHWGRAAPGRGSGGSASTLRLGFLGRLDTKKNLDVLIGAVALLPHEVTLRVAGDGPPRMRETLRRLARERGVEHRVEWLGFLGGSDKRDFLASIDLLVMPSAYECFGMAAAEALAAGVPVLVSPRTGIAELVEAYGCGFVAEPTVEGLRQELFSLFKQPLRLGDAADRVGVAVMSELSFTAHGERLRQEYAPLVDARRGIDAQERLRTAKGVR